MDERLEKIRHYKATIHDFESFIEDKIKETQTNNMKEDLKNVTEGYDSDYDPVESGFKRGDWQNESAIVLSMDQNSVTILVGEFADDEALDLYLNEDDPDVSGKYEDRVLTIDMVDWLEENPDFE